MCLGKCLKIITKHNGRKHTAIKIDACQGISGYYE